jgi:hypothetical protein
MIKSTQLSGSGMASISPYEVSILSMLASCAARVVRSSISGRKSRPITFPGGPGAPGREDGIDSAAAAKVENRVAWLDIGEAQMVGYPRARLIAAARTCANSSVLYSFCATAAVEAGTCRCASRTKSLISLLCIRSRLMGRAPRGSRLDDGRLYPGTSSRAELARKRRSSRANSSSPQQALHRARCSSSLPSRLVCGGVEVLPKVPCGLPDHPASVVDQPAAAGRAPPHQLVEHPLRLMQPADISPILYTQHPLTSPLGEGVYGSGHDETE